MLFLFLLFQYIGIRFDCHLSQFGVYRLLLRNCHGRWVMPPHPLLFQRKSVVTTKVEHLGRFRPFPIVQMLNQMSAVCFAGKQKKSYSMLGRNGLYPGFETVLVMSAPSLCLETPHLTKSIVSYFFPLSPIVIQFGSDLPKFGVHQSPLSFCDARRVTLSNQ